MLQAYLATLVGLIAMQVAPGPNLLAVASAGMGQGRRSALLIALGVASGAAIRVFLVAMGIGVAVKNLPELLTILKFAGGGYLMWIGARALFSALKGQNTRIAQTESTCSDWASWRRGLFVVMSNPKAALGWAAIASFMFGAGLTVLQVAAFAPLAALSAIMVYGGYALLFSTGTAVRTYQRFWRGVELVFGGVFGAMGASLLLAGVRDLRP